MCITTVPINILADQKVPIRRSCLNDTVGIKPGECGNLSGGLPGTAERICVCTGNFCNGAVSSNSVLTAFSATLYKLTLGSSLLFSLLLHLL
uniref:Protein quiver n=1 Tax=Ditylenchus dipsaci TaxID=166011 RepID=A0A915CRI5_9BILA